MLVHATPGDLIRAVNRVKAGNAFIGAANEPGVSAQYSHVQFLNPAASGVTAILFRVSGELGAAGLFTLRRYDVALANLSSTLANKKLGGAVPSCEIRGQANGSLLGTGLAKQSIAASAPYDFVDREPLFLAAGQGVLIVPSAVNLVCNGLFEWLEES